MRAFTNVALAVDTQVDQTCSDRTARATSGKVIRTRLIATQVQIPGRSERAIVKFDVLYLRMPVNADMLASIAGWRQRA